MKLLSSTVVEQHPEVRIHISVLAGDEEGEPQHRVDIVAVDWPSGEKFLDKRIEYYKH